MKDEHDSLSVTFPGLVVGIAYFAHNAYRDVVANAEVVMSCSGCHC